MKFLKRTFSGGTFFDRLQNENYVIWSYVLLYIRLAQIFTHIFMHMYPRGKKIGWLADWVNSGDNQMLQV